MGITLEGGNLTYSLGASAWYLSIDGRPGVNTKLLESEFSTPSELIAEGNRAIADFNKWPGILEGHCVHLRRLSAARYYGSMEREGEYDDIDKAFDVAKYYYKLLNGRPLVPAFG
jgi:hypothetical protein